MASGGVAAASLNFFTFIYLLLIVDFHLIFDTVFNKEKVTKRVGVEYI